MEKQPFIKSYHIFAIGTILLWSSAFSCTKLALDQYAADSLGVLRYLFATLLLLVICILKKIKLPDKKDIPLFFLSGAFGFTIYMVAFNKGMQTITSATSSILVATGPIFTAVLAYFIYKEDIKPLGVFAITIEFTGILVLTLWDGIFSVNKGILWTISAAFSFSLYNIVQKKLFQKYTVFQTTAYSIFAGTLLLLVYLPSAWPEYLHASVLQKINVMYMGMFPSGIAYILWGKALSIAEKTSDVTNYMFITPLLAMILGFIVVMELPTRATFVGGGIILAGLVLFMYSKKETTEHKEIHQNSHME